MKKLVCFLTLAFLFPAIAGAFPSWTAVGIGDHDVEWSPGGTGTLAVTGTFGGTTVTFFWCAPLAGAAECFEVNAAACTFTARGTCDFFRGPGRLRLIVTGGAPSINAVAAGPTQATVGVGGSGGITGLLDGPVTFGDAAGALAQAADFFYDEPQGFLGIGTAIPGIDLHIAQQVDDGALRISGFDDRSGDVLNFFVNSFGSGSIDANNTLVFTAGAQVNINSSGTGSVRINNANADAVRLVEGGGAVSIGTVSPQTNIHISESNTDTIPTMEIEQLSTGDAGMQFSIIGDSYAMGIDNSDDDQFKISYAAAAGTAVLGTNDRLSIDTAGNVTVDTTTAQLLLPSSNDAVTPTLAFGDEDMGFYEQVDDVLQFAAGGIARITFSASLIGSSNASLPAMLMELPTATNPVFVPDQSNSTTGIGGVSGEVSIIVTNTEILNASSSGVVIGAGLTLGLPSSASPPVACSGAVDGHVYWDTGQNLICRCDSVAWTGAGGGATCV